ncbi:MAG TPA: hypothetical protein V6D28_28130 [Leptolyngbyaceae cyanobacterium]
MGGKLYNPDAVLDQNYPSGYSFCQKFLSSPEFTVEFLKDFNVFKRTDLKTKEKYAIDVAEALFNKEISPHEVLVKYVKKPRTWLSIKQGTYSQFPQMKSPEELLSSFGEPGWYGPIRDPASSRIWYIYTRRIEHYIPREAYTDHEGNRKTYDIAYIRWPIIAEVSQKYVALSWEGFSYTSEDKLNSKNQFSFWLYISEIFEELKTLLGGDWKHPELHILLLHTLWNKYHEKPLYNWSHKRVRAESSGIALNAQCTGDDEIDIGDKGLKGLSRTLAEAALDSLENVFPHDPQKLNQVETAILNTLIREWGTKSYEFSLKKALIIANADSDSISFDQKTQTTQTETVFRVHCYFGLNPPSKNQDSLQHLKCYKECGGSVGVLRFLLAELGIE